MIDSTEEMRNSGKRGVFKLPKTGYPYFGQAIGILMFDAKIAVTDDMNVPAEVQTFTRIPGDVGNATSFGFPVQYKLMDGIMVNDIICVKPTLETEKKVAALAQDLEAEGVRAIATTCGLMTWFQPVMSEAVDIPVFSSSLLQVPVVSRVIGKNKKVGIMTVDAQFLTPESLRCVGIDESVPHVVYGLENSGLFVKETDPDKRRVALENILVPAAEAMIRENPDVAAIVYESTVLAPTSAAVQKATGLPVFDVITLIKWAFNAVVQKQYDGFM